jgi:hypothetical protein
MFRRVMIGLWTLGAVALLATDASAGCATIGGKRVCASYITGGSEIGIVTAEGYTPNKSACPAVVTTQSGVPEACNNFEDEGGPSFCECFPDSPSCEIDLTRSLVIQQDTPSPPVPAAAVTLKLVGTIDKVPDSRRCGLGPDDDQTCDITGVVFCGDSGDPKDKHGDKHDGKHTGHTGGTRQRETTAGPLTVNAPGFAQVDPTASGGDGRHFAGFRFQINEPEQVRLCDAGTEGEFRTFVALEGFFEACVVPATNFFCDTGDPTQEQCTCVREFCTVGPPRSPDEIQQYQCRPV